MNTTSGVYLIRHRCSGRVYVGASDSIERRFNDHRSKLKHGSHPKRLLQEDCDRDGIDAFDWEIVQTFTFGGSLASCWETLGQIRSAEFDTIQRLSEQGTPLYNSDRLILDGSFTTPKAAERLGVHPATLRAWADAGKVPVVRLPSGYRRFEPEVIERVRREMGMTEVPKETRDGE